MDAALPLERRSAAESKPATFGTASLVFAALTIILPVAMMFVFGQKASREENAPDNGGWGMLAALGLLLAGAVLGAFAAGLSGLVGTITGVVALACGEQHAWRPVVGLIVNAPVLGLVALAAISVWVNRGG